MLSRIAMVTAIASLVLMFGAPKDALACHKGKPHRGEICDDGGGGGRTPPDLNNLMLVDANGNDVGPVYGFSYPDLFAVLVTPDQRAFAAPIAGRQLFTNKTTVYDVDFYSTGYPWPNTVFFDELGCVGNAFLEPNHVIPGVLYESALTDSGPDGVRAWVATSFTPLTKSTQYLGSAIRSGGQCQNFSNQPSVEQIYPAEQLTDDVGFPVDDLHDLYPLPLRLEAR